MMAITQALRDLTSNWCSRSSTTVIVQLIISRRDWWPEDLVTGHNRGKLVSKARNHITKGARVRMMLVIDASEKPKDSCSCKEFTSSSTLPLQVLRQSPSLTVMVAVISGQSEYIGLLTNI